MQRIVVGVLAALALPAGSPKPATSSPKLSLDQRIADAQKRLEQLEGVRPPEELGRDGLTRQKGTQQAQWHNHWNNWHNHWNNWRNHWHNH